MDIYGCPVFQQDLLKMEIFLHDNPTKNKLVGFNALPTQIPMLFYRNTNILLIETYTGP